MTIVKFMLSSVLTGMVGIYLLQAFGLAKLSIKITILDGNIIGGLLFGLGWGVLGYCPGTSLGLVGVYWQIPGSDERPDESLLSLYRPEGRTPAASFQEWWLIFDDKIIVC
mgnify:CR=1 FL=1